MDNKALLWLFITITFYIISTYILFTFDKTLGIIGGLINISSIVLSIPIFNYDDKFSGAEVLEIFGVIELSLTFSLLLIKTLL